MAELYSIFSHIRIQDVIDISIVAVVFYTLVLLIKQTQGEQLAKGILILIVGNKIAEILEFQMLSTILREVMRYGVTALLIVFQPELRRILEYVGQTKLRIKSFTDQKDTVDKTVIEILEATKSLSRQKIGALIVFERQTGLDDIVQTGTAIHALVSRQLLINIFIPNTPLHDGAVVMRGDSVIAAGCFLPLTENKYLNQELGTRHRAALGISEKSDCISLVVSEETGGISIAQSGKLFRNLGEETLQSLLNSRLKQEDSKRLLNGRGILDWIFSRKT